MTGPRRMDMSPIATSPPPHVGDAHTDAPGPTGGSVSFDDPPPAHPRPNGKREFLPTLPKVTLVLPNVGSVARDHLASERTWLSYVRTSLGVASTGVALVQLFSISVDDDGVTTPHDANIQRFARPLGAITVFFGLYVLGIGVQRYFRVQHALTQGEFPVARVTVLGITGILAALIAVTFGILVAIPRE